MHKPQHTQWPPHSSGMQLVKMHQPQHTPWPPHFQLPDYQGPYPRPQLEAARKELIDTLTSQTSSWIVERLKPRLGIDSPYGEAQVPPPVRECEPRPSSSRIDSSDCIERSMQNASFESPHSFSGRNPPQSFSSSPQAGPSRASTLSPLLETPTFHSTPTRNSADQHLMYSSLDGGLPCDSGYFEDTSRFDAPTSVTSSGQHKHAEDDLQGFRNGHFFPQASSKNRTPVMSLKRKLVPNSDSSVDKRAKTVMAHDNSTARNLVSPTSSKMLLYKCDFCQFTSAIKDEMGAHLSSAKHFSGSLYNAVVTPDGPTLVTVEKMLAVKNQYSMTKALMVACPDCHEIFEDIFMCAMHHKYAHGSVNGCYAICPVVRHETITFTITPTCVQCEPKAIYQTQRDLHLHWKKEPTHHPLHKLAPTTSDVFIIFICPYCSKIYFENFLLCKCHVLKHERASEHYALEVKHVMQPRMRHEILPFNTAGQRKDGLRLELDILLNLRKFYDNDISGAKAKAQLLKERITALKSMLGVW